jgi:hypothetical protein
MVLNVNTAAVGASAATEAGIGTETSAAMAAAAEVLTGVMPMGADLDSVQFAAAVNAIGAAYIGTVMEHVADRELFAEAQDLAAATYTATEVVNDTALSL